MKLAVVLFATFALRAVGAIPFVPGDNRHYVEGESRYIWMHDKEGNPLLIDLEAEVNNSYETRGGNRNKYWLFTRRNQGNRQVLVNGNANSIRNSNYNGNRPTKVITHGWISNGNEDWIHQIKDAFLNQADVNVIVLDWREDASNPTYLPAVRAVPGVGRALGNFLNFLFNTAGGSWNNVHLTGHSLGAHVMGNAGRVSRPARLTGLDPAGPRWRDNANALNRNCAVYVESIHTNGGDYGINDAISHVDFYPNGGQIQPGCWTAVCSHGRAPLLFASSITSNHLVGRRCTGVQQANRNQCTGATFPLGNNNLGKQGSGIYALRTSDRWPY